jgi:heterodisulfide reductase subunit B
VAAGLEMMVVDCQVAHLWLDTAAAVVAAATVAEMKLLCAALQS